MVKRIVHSFCIIFISSIMLFAEDSPKNINDLESLLQAIEARDKNITTISFSFSQEMEMVYGGEKQEMTGTAYFKKPDRIRIENRTPAKNTFITDGNTAWYYTPSQKQVMTGSWDDMALQSGNFFKGIVNLSESIRDFTDGYLLSYGGKNGSYYLLTLRPKEKGSALFEMKLWIEENELIPHKTMLTMETIVLHTRITKVRINKDIEDKLFTFKKPSRVEEVPFPF